MSRQRQLSVSLLLLALLVTGNCQADPRSHYLIHCMGCHLADGSGQPPDVPAFGTDTLALSQSPGGRAYLVQVPGASQAPLDDSELAGVLNWILGDLVQAAQYDAFTTEEISRHRSTVLLNPVGSRAALLATD
ncbi:MAG: hypothetical protein O3B72_11560 [Proteobacteria bacterium]|nr:hypothetical protein [Pseudomonadota bacterium]